MNSVVSAVNIQKFLWLFQSLKNSSYRVCRSSRVTFQEFLGQQSIISHFVLKILESVIIYKTLKMLLYTE